MAERKEEQEGGEREEAFYVGTQTLKSGWVSALENLTVRL